MKILIEFDGKEEALAAMNASKYLSANEEADNYLRLCLKHGDNSESVVTVLEQARRLLNWQE